ncbi:MAG: DUF2628 domain-containing protein, partial [Deltaproteobacteria bacterium]
TEEDFADFIGKNADIYFRKFKKFSINAPDRFAISWNWAAFFFTYIWFAYRKMYRWAGLIFITGTALGIILPLLFPFWWIGICIAANFIYFRHARKNILELKTAHRFSKREQLSVALQVSGGVNKWILAIAIPFVLIELFLSALASF